MEIWEFDVQGLVNRVRAVVRRDVKDEELLEAGRWAPVRNIWEVNTHDLANGVRASATLDAKDEELLGVQRAGVGDQGVGLCGAGCGTRFVHLVGSALRSLLENPGISPPQCRTDYPRCPILWTHSLTLRSGCPAFTLRPFDLGETRRYPEFRMSGFYPPTLRLGRKTALPGSPDVRC